MEQTFSMMQSILTDCSHKCSTDVRKDVAKLKHRLDHEGLSFLTISLPRYLQDFTQALENRKIDPSLFLGWKKRLCLPAFLQGFTKLVFDARTGDLLEEPKISAIQAVRQICSVFKKIKIECTPERTLAAMQQFCKTDDEIRDIPDSIESSYYTTFDSVSRIVVSSVFPETIEYDCLIPKHGPGSTSQGLVGNKKYRAELCEWHVRLERYFSCGGTFFNSEESYNLSKTDVPHLLECEERPVRVVTVPKTQVAPRVIALEPIVMQMWQQPVKTLMVKALESSKLTKGHLNFTDQSINQNLALLSSKDGKLATLDLSEASDRVHKDPVYRMLNVNPSLRDLVFITRSKRAAVSKSEFVDLNKFASMGSALCFPIESLYFYILCICARLEHKHLQPSIETIYKVTRDIYVYGDDIIVPSNEVDSIITWLHIFGNKVGLAKSFWDGRFRESCGCDAYDGVDITPIYIRQPLHGKWKSNHIASFVATANLFWKKGLCSSANLLRQMVEREVGRLPYRSEHSEGLGWTFCDEQVKTRYNKGLQRLEVRTLVPKASKKSDALRNYSALSKCLLKLEHRLESVGRKGEDSPIPDWTSERSSFDDAMFDDKEHLETVPRFGALTLKRQWVSV